MGHVKVGLAEVRRARIKRGAATQSWREAIRKAHSNGCSLRDIAEAAGVAHTRVLEIVREE